MILSLKSKTLTQGTARSAHHAKGGDQDRSQKRQTGLTRSKNTGELRVNISKKCTGQTYQRSY